MENFFEKIDREICSSLEVVKQLSSNLQFQQVCEFYPGAELSKQSWDAMATPGVYMLEINTDQSFDSFTEWIKKFQIEWERPEYIYQFVPNLKKKRIDKLSELKEWIPIYIGKSKWIGKRILEHLYLDLERRTFALKLSKRLNLKEYKFKISIIPVQVKNYDWIVPVIENTLRDKFNPIIGRQ